MSSGVSPEARDDRYIYFRFVFGLTRPVANFISWSAFLSPEHGAGLVQIGALDKRLAKAQGGNGGTYIYFLMFN